MTDNVPWHFQLSHDRVIAADPADVWQALTEASAGDLPVARALMAVRALPARALGRKFDVGEGVSMLDGARQRFSILTWDEPCRIELARIAKFWHPVPIDAPKVDDHAAFSSFHQPGFAKALMGFELQAVPGGTKLTTTTRVSATNARAWAQFGLYWMAIRPGAVVIRHALLTAIQRRAVGIKAQRATHVGSQTGQPDRMQFGQRYRSDLRISADLMGWLSDPPIRPPRPAADRTSASQPHPG